MAETSGMTGWEFARRVKVQVEVGRLSPAAARSILEAGDTSVVRTIEYLSPMGLAELNARLAS